MATVQYGDATLIFIIKYALANSQSYKNIHVKWKDHKK